MDLLQRQQRAFLPSTEYLSPDVVMLVANDGWDVRALKEARSLAASGLSVTLVGRRRNRNDLPRFTDEFGIDIVCVPQILDQAACRTHLEGGVFRSMNFREKVIASVVDYIFRFTNLSINSKSVPPPVNGALLEKLLALGQQPFPEEAPPRRVRSLWFDAGWHALARAVKKLLGWKQAPGAELLHAVAVLIIAVVTLPLSILAGTLFVASRVAFHAMRLTLKVLRRMGRIGRALSVAITNVLRRTGAQVYRYARFFLFTIEYGETVARLKPKVIHAHDLYTLQAAVRIARWIGAEVVYDAHELESDRRAGTKPAMAKWIIDQEKTYAPLATGCVTVSHAIADTMQNDLGVARPTVVFNAPIVLEAPEGFETRTIRADLGLSPQTPLFVFVGKIWEIADGNQKIDLIIRGVCRNPEYHLALIGPLSDLAKEQIEKLVEEEGSQARVHLVPPIPSEAIIHYIADADAGIYFMWPDTRNIDLTIPNKLFEFSLAGLPLVVTDLTSTRWFCTIAGNAVFVKSQQVEEVAQACREVIDRQQELRPNQEKLAQIRREYSWEAQGARLVEFYKSLLKRAGNRGLQ